MKKVQFLEKKGEVSLFLRNLWSDSKPLMKMFCTEGRGYVYDTGTNRIFACGDLEFKLLNNLMKFEIGEALDTTASSCLPQEFIKALDGIQAAIKEKNILKTKRPIRFGGSHFKSLRELIQNGLEMIQLEITERCNLRCAYCIYNPNFKEKRNHGTRNMSLDTAIRAIEHLGRSSGCQKRVAVTFYGGEPLLCFPVIKSCVQYSRKVLTKKDIGFSITTNGTLMTPSIAKYFFDEGFGVHVSIDGPEDIHDEYRKDIKGVGSFQRTISGLKTLYDIYGDKKDKITLSMVYSPPYSKERVDKMAELWAKYPWLSRKIVVFVSYAKGFHPPEISSQTRISNEYDFSLTEWAQKKFIEDYQKGSQPHPIAAGIVEKEMARLMQRRVYTAPIEEYWLNGCCVPSARKQFVSVDGTLMICERIGNAPAIGSVATGIDVENVKKIYVEDYSKESLPYCSGCWAVHMCSICYVHAFSESRIDIQLKKTNCSAMRESLVRSLMLYCRLLEINENGLDYLEKWQLS